MNDKSAMTKTESSENNAVEHIKPQQFGQFLAEKHPNLTLLESGQNPGSILRSARERLGYSLSEISAQTKINERQLEAIESGDVSRMPPETFAKAFIKSYCKALKVDSAPIIMSFGFSEAASQVKPNRLGQPESARSEALESQMPDSSKRLSTLNFDRKAGKKSLGYLVVLAVVLVMFMFYIPVFLSGQDTQAVDSEAVQANEPPVVSTNPSPLVESQFSNDNSQLATSGNGIAEGEAAIFPALQPPPTVEINSGAISPDSPAVATGSPSSPGGGLQQPALAPSLPVVVPAQAAVPSAPLPNSVVSAATATVPAPIAAAPVPPPVRPQALGSEQVLKFNFQQQSWVTVRDGNDKVLISQLNDAGSRLEVRGVPPFKLIVGNAKSVNVTTNGKSVDLNASIRGEVARVTIP